MTKILKCNVCNIVIDELLSYVQNKISVIDEETLKRICVTAFSSSEISRSKTLLFESLPTDQRKIRRKGGGKEERDLDDIVSLFKTIDPDVMPVFVARELEKLPPILFDHLDCTKLLKDLTRLNAEIEELKNTYATVKQVEELRSDIHNLKYASIPPTTMITPGAFVNIRRGAWNMESGPMGMTHSYNDATDDERTRSLVKRKTYQSATTHNDTDANCKVVNSGIECTPLSRPKRKIDLLSRPKEAESEDAAAATVTVSCERGEVECMEQSLPPPPPHTTAIAPLSVLSPIDPSSPKQVPPARELGDNAAIIAQKQHVSNGDKKENSTRSSTWQTVNKRKKKPKYRYLGEIGKAEASVSSFKAADKKIPIFITNVHSDTMESDIVDYIKTKTQERVILEKIITKKVLSHKAYKFFVTESKLSLFLDEKIWPEGIIFRRFMHFKDRRTERMSAVDGPLHTNNG